MARKFTKREDNKIIRHIAEHSENISYCFTALSQELHRSEASIRVRYYGHLRPNLKNNPKKASFILGDKAMNYKEKYEAALERAKKFHTPDSNNSNLKAVLKLIFPELAESEDERIRKELIQFLRDYPTNLPNGKYSRSDFFAWLEKQKERGPLTKEEEYTLQRIIEYLEDETCPPEWISLLHDIYCLPYEKQKEQKPAENVSKEEYVKRFKALCDAYEIKLPNREYDIYHLCYDLSKLSIDSGKQKFVDDKAFEEWIDDWWKHNKVNNPDSYDKGDEIQFDERGFKNFCRGIRNMYQQKPAEWHPEDEQNLNVCLSYIKDASLRSWLIDAIHVRYDKSAKWSEEDEEHLKWICRIVHGRRVEGEISLAEEAELGKWMDKWLDHAPQQKVEWSEEDEKMVQFWNMYYEHKVGDWPNKDVVEHLERFKEWLNNRFKSLRPEPKGKWAKRLEEARARWKPSEEQMEKRKFKNSAEEYDYFNPDSKI